MSAGRVRWARWPLPVLLAGTLLVSGMVRPPVSAAGARVVFEWGDDYYSQDGFDSGQTALRGAQSVPVPVPLTLQSGVTGVEAGFSHSLALVTGSVWAWGRSTEGQLGDGTLGTGTAPGRPTPGPVRTSAGVLSGVTAVAGGGYHSLALTSGGNVYAWGSNSNGQLGDGTLETRLLAGLARLNATTPLTGIVAIAAGRTHSLALRSDGTVWAWGSDSNGQLGDGATTDRSFAVQVTDISGAPLTGVTDIGAGTAHSLAVRSDGSVWAWGYNLLGQLGDGTTTDRHRAVQVQSGSGNLSTGTTSSLAWPLHRLAAGNDSSLALASDGSVWAWGSNAAGQLDAGAATGSTRAVQAVGLSQVQSIASGQSHGLALLGQGVVMAWGADGAGQLGDGSHGLPTCSCRPVPVPVAGIVAAGDVAAGGDNSVAVALAQPQVVSAPAVPGQVMAWGDNTLGELGNGTTSGCGPPPCQYWSGPVSSLAASAMTAVSAGSQHSLALGADRQAYEWGLTEGVQSMPARVQLPGGAAAVAVADGSRHHLVLTDSGQVMTWGDNTYGQMGRITGQNQTPQAAALPPHVTASAIAAGGFQSLAMTSDGLYAWGNQAGGAPPTTVSDAIGGVPFLSGVVVAKALPTRVPLPAGSTVSTAPGALAAGDMHSLVIANGGDRVLAWGSDGSGQLGTEANPDPSDHPLPAAVVLPQGVRIVELAAGNRHSLALSSTGEVWAWGDNTFGQLGTGSFGGTTTPVDTHLRARHIAAGWNYSLAIDPSGQVLSWGMNDHGQLGRPSSSSLVPACTSSSGTACDPVPAAVGGLAGASALAAGVSDRWVCGGCSHPGHNLVVVPSPDLGLGGAGGRASVVRADSVRLGGGAPVQGGLAVCDTGLTATPGTTPGQGALCPGTTQPRDPLLGTTPVVAAVDDESVTVSPAALAGGGPPTTVQSSSRLASFQLLFGRTPLVTADGLDASATATCAGATQRASASASSSLGSLSVLGVSVATRPVGSRIVVDPVGGHPGTPGHVSVYGSPVVINPTGGRVPMAIVTLNYSRHDLAGNSETAAAAAVTFPSNGPLRSLITGTVLISYAQAACP